MIFLICLILFNIGNIPMIAYNNISQNSISHEDNNKPNCWVNEIRYKIIKKYIDKYNLEVSVISDAMPGGIINRTGVGFTINRPVSKQKARQILVDCVEDYIQAINNKKELRPYLKDYPVTAKNIEITLFIKDAEGKDLFYPHLSFAGVILGCIEYTTRDPKDPYADKTREEETFEEAVKKAKEELPKEDML